MNIICGKCGHEADIDDWTRTPVGGPLPSNTYQCPACRLAFERVSGKPAVLANGFVVPGPVSLVPVAAML